MKIMRTSILLAAAWISALSGFELQAQSTMTVEGKTPAGFTEEKPAYLHIKQIVVTREAGNSYSFDITLHGNIPSNKDDKILYYIGFDIDNNPSTGGNAARSNFGQDMGVFFTKPAGTNRFEDSSNSVEVGGKSYEMKPTSVKIGDNKVEFKLRSPIFSRFETFKFFVCAEISRYKNGLRTSEMQVDSITSPTVALKSKQ